ncbi:MAG: hypothetical protein ACKVP0_11340 [Pirellulaceae bacterium]
MLQTLPQPLMHPRLAATNESASSICPIYYVVWRSRKSLPWQSEEFTGRFQAHCRYFALLDRGTEAYVEKRQPLEF